MQKQDLRSFDIVQFLEDHDIQYWTSGRNVRKNNVNITCPFCGDHDYSGNNHLGIDLKTKTFNCWICSAGKNKVIISLIMRLLNCSYGKANQLIKKYNNEILSRLSSENREYKDISPDKNYEPNQCLTPSFKFLRDLSGEFPKLHVEYLKNRNFDPDFLIPKFKLRATNNIGNFKFRIVAPIILDNQIISFLTRDVTNKASIPYLPLPDNQSIIPYKNSIYNIDNCKSGSILIVEGITDCWRFGDNCGATMSYNFTNQQINLLVKKRIKNCFIMFDAEPEAQQKAKDLQIKLLPFMDHVERLELDKGDPAELPQSEADALKKELKL